MTPDPDPGVKDSSDRLVIAICRYNSWPFRSALVGLSDIVLIVAGIIYKRRVCVVCLQASISCTIIIHGTPADAIHSGLKMSYDSSSCNPVSPGWSPGRTAPVIPENSPHLCLTLFFLNSLKYQRVFTAFCSFYCGRHDRISLLRSPSIPDLNPNGLHSMGNVHYPIDSMDLHGCSVLGGGIADAT